MYYSELGVKVIVVEFIIVNEDNCVLNQNLIFDSFVSNKLKIIKNFLIHIHPLNMSKRLNFLINGAVIVNGFSDIKIENMNFKAETYNT